MTNKPSQQAKEKAFNDLQGALNFLTEYFNFRGNPATDGDFWQLNIAKSKLDFLEKLMTTD
jgi:hypothetical protein